MAENANEDGTATGNTTSTSVPPNYVEAQLTFFAWQPSPARSNCPMPTPKKAAAPKNALSKPVQPDAALTSVVGKDPLPRTELTKKLWEYIRKHELQDPKNKRNIRADEKLLAVFDGKKVVSMFEMTKLVNGHLV